MSMLSMRYVIWTFGGGVGVVPVTFLVENFDSLMKIFNILKSSILSVQKTSIFVSVFIF